MFLLHQVALSEHVQQLLHNLLPIGFSGPHHLGHMLQPSHHRVFDFVLLCTQTNVCKTWVKTLKIPNNISAISEILQTWLILAASNSF